MISVGDAGTKKRDDIFEGDHIEDSFLSTHFAKGVQLFVEISDEVKERVLKHYEGCNECKQKVDLFRQAMSLIPFTRKKEES